MKTNFTTKAPPVLKTGGDAPTNNPAQKEEINEAQIESAPVPAADPAPDVAPAS
jgi:hypothetical protein